MAASLSAYTVYFLSSVFFCFFNEILTEIHMAKLILGNSLPYKITPVQYILSKILIMQIHGACVV